MSKRNGKALEELVAFIESTLGKAGLTVTSNDKVFDDDGNQVAEFDVIVEGRLGTADIRWLIECRDRPSAGAAPASWIEQLYGRRRRFNFSAVTAVSTTGFAPDAVRFAADNGIDLRHVKSLDPNSFNWFQIRELIQVESRLNLRGILMHFGKEVTAEEISAIEEAIASSNQIDATEPPIIRVVDGSKLTYGDVFGRSISGMPDVSQVPEGQQLIINVDYPNDEDHFLLNTRLGPKRVRKFEFTSVLSRHITHLPVLENIEYAGSITGEIFAQVIRFPTMGGAGDQFDLEIRNVAATGETYVVATPLDPEVRINFEGP